MQSLQLLDLNRVIREINEMLPRLIGEDIELIFAPGKNVGKVKADPVQIEQIGRGRPRAWGWQRCMEPESKPGLQLGPKLGRPWHHLQDLTAVPAKPTPTKTPLPGWLGGAGWGRNSCPGER